MINWSLNSYHGHAHWKGISKMNFRIKIKISIKIRLGRLKSILYEGLFLYSYVDFSLSLSLIYF
jgi:hypothetical protein